MQVKKILAGVVFLCLSLHVFAADSPNMGQVYQAWQAVSSDKLQENAIFGDVSIETINKAINESVLPEEQKSLWINFYKQTINLRKMFMLIEKENLYFGAFLNKCFNEWIKAQRFKQVSNGKITDKSKPSCAEKIKKNISFYLCAHNLKFGNPKNDEYKADTAYIYFRDEKWFYTGILNKDKEKPIVPVEIKDKRAIQIIKKIKKSGEQFYPTGVQNKRLLKFITANYAKVFLDEQGFREKLLENNKLFLGAIKATKQYIIDHATPSNSACDLAQSMTKQQVLLCWGNRYHVTSAYLNSEDWTYNDGSIVNFNNGEVSMFMSME